MPEAAETTTEPPEVEAEVIEEGEVLPPVDSHEVTTGQALERVPSREVLMPMDPDQVIEGMERYQQMLPRLLDSTDYQGTGSDAFVKKSGWRKIARAFNLSVTIVSIDVARDEEGQPVRAECVARATAPNGQVSDADGYCSLTEFTGRRAGDPKLENTLRATATTRAKNRAIADLVGMGEVSAEEVTSAGPPFGPPQTESEAKKLRAALKWLLPPDQAKAVWEQITKECEGYVPHVVSAALTTAIRHRKDTEEGGEGDAS